ncbi:HAMP domain-containing sensor histidine kinase [Calidifontibacillus oryziterrae]|uniref:HAMP domain-containing sensor histidine kinase n=1 Tax=Calidifontibacillus oryziterrae TaxID=1191699 RepID=UPI0002D4FFF9|nr:sensor histidine kinase [Calidifontibacillus oryziterrae]
MPDRKLTNIQWQFIRQYSQAAVTSVLFGAVVFFVLWEFAFSIDALQSWSLQYLNLSIPAYPGLLFAIFMIIVMSFVAAFVGIVWGYIQGNLLKKRIETLLQSTIKLERGNLATRIPDLGRDEIGELGRHFNEMAKRFQEQVSSLQRLSTHNAELADQVKEAAIIEERQRLARELHDAVSQQLFAISMTMAALKRTVQLNPEKASQQVELVEEMAATAQSEMRALLLHLRPAHLEGKTLNEGIRGLLAEFLEKHQNIQFSWKLAELPNTVTKAIEDHLFRIVQEALSNILRHAKAENVEVRLTVVNDQIRLKITDDGIGFNEDETKTSSYGMSLMKERAAEIGGVMTLSTAPGQGTMIEVTVPILPLK